MAEAIDCRRRRARRRAAVAVGRAASSSRDGEIVGPGRDRTVPGRARTPRSRRCAAAGDRARGATAYTTLEPCDHDGNTPPCTAGARSTPASRAWSIAVVDPDAEGRRARARPAARRGHRRSSVGAGRRRRSRTTSAPYLHQRRTGRAFALLKTAMSLDGRTAAADGTSQWITSPEAPCRRAPAARRVARGARRARTPRSPTRRASPCATRRSVRGASRSGCCSTATGRVPVDGPLADASLAPTVVYATAAMPAATVAGVAGRRRRP